MTAGVLDSLAGPDGRRHAVELLARAGGGDRDAFMEFYDATCASAYGLLLCRLADASAAERATCTLYVDAWTRAAEYPGSRLSPLAWLVSLAGVAEPGARDWQACR